MTNVREDMEKMRNLYTVGGSVIEAATMKNIWKTLKKKKKKTKRKRELPYDPAIPLLGICPEKMKTLN